MTTDTAPGTGSPGAALPLFVGTYTERLGHVDGKAEGVLRGAFDPRSGEVHGIGVLAPTRNPSWVAVDPSAGVLYAVNEGGAGTVSTFRLSDGTLLGQVDSHGEDPCHLSLSADGRHVVVANYSSGTIAAFPRLDDGTLGEASDVVQHRGGSVDPERQSSAHPHMVFVDPVSGHVLVPDLGLDAVVGYELDPKGTFTELFRVSVPAGSGPRHLVAAPDGQRLYLVTELGNTVIPLTRAGEGLVAGEPVSTLPQDFTGSSGAAAIRISPSGRTLLVSNRGHDSVALLRVDPASGVPVLRGTTEARGSGPRDMQLSPDGRVLLVACQDSGLLHGFRLDEQAGRLEHLHTLDVPTPVCLVFA
jgi:6-phosphogluconolactonase